MSAVMQSRGQFGLYKIPWVKSDLAFTKSQAYAYNAIFSVHFLGGILTN